MKSRTLRARGTAHLRKRFRAECCVYEKTVELNATSCSNTPAGPNKLVHLIEAGEAPPRRWWGFAERLDVAGVRGEFGEIGQDRSGPALFTWHG